MGASVIGLSKFVKTLSICIKPGGTLVALVKPQFEASRDVVSKGEGVVTGEVDRQAWLVAMTDMKATLHNAVVAAAMLNGISKQLKTGVQAGADGKLYFRNSHNNGVAMLYKADANGMNPTIVGAQAMLMGAEITNF